jgi:hypothetical protein
MTILIVLVVLAVLFGLGAVIEGLFWLFLITFVLLVAAAWFGYSKFRTAT